MKKFIKSLIAVSMVIALPGLVAVTEAGDLKTGTLVGKIEGNLGRKGQNAVVYLRGVTGNYEPAQKPAVLDQKRKVFIPHVLAVQKGQKVHFKASDPFTHNVHLYWGRRSMFNKSQPPDSMTEWVPPRKGEYLILCNIHSEMSAFVLVFNHPFFCQVASSQFKIENIPEGTYTLVVVRDVRGKLKELHWEVTIKGGEINTVSIQL